MEVQINFIRDTEHSALIICQWTNKLKEIMKMCLIDGLLHNFLKKKCVQHNTNDVEIHDDPHFTKEEKSHFDRYEKNFFQIDAKLKNKKFSKKIQENAKHTSSFGEIKYNNDKNNYYEIDHNDVNQYNEERQKLFIVIEYQYSDRVIEFVVNCLNGFKEKESPLSCEEQVLAILLCDYLGLIYTSYIISE